MIKGIEFLSQTQIFPPLFLQSVAEFKEFERRFKFKPRLKYGWFPLKLYQMFQDLSLRLIKPGFGRFKPRLKFFKFHL